MSAQKIREQVHSVGVIDWNARHFHGFSYATPRGTTYNSYLIADEQNTLIDGVYAPFTDEWLANIRQVISLDKLQNFVVNHIEPDHSGSIPKLLELCPGLKVYGTAKCFEGLVRE